MTWRRMREAEGRLLPLMWRCTLETWGQDGLDEAYAVFFDDTPVPDDPQMHPEHESLFSHGLASSSRLRALQCATAFPARCAC